MRNVFVFVYFLIITFHLFSFDVQQLNTDGQFQIVKRSCALRSVKIQGGIEYNEAIINNLLLLHFQSSGVVDAVSINSEDQDLKDSSISEKYGAQLVISSLLYKIGDTYTFSIKTYDYIAGQNTVTRNEQFNSDFLDNISSITLKTIDNISERYKIYNSSEIKSIYTLLDEDSSGVNRIASHFIEQDDRFLFENIKKNKLEYQIPVINSRDNFIFYSNEPVEFGVLINDRVYYSQNEILVLNVQAENIDEETTEKIEFKLIKDLVKYREEISSKENQQTNDEDESDITQNDETPDNQSDKVNTSINKTKYQILSYNVNNKFNVISKNILFFTDLQRPAKNIFIDNSAVLTTNGFMGGEFRLGIGVPFNGTLEAAVYFRFAALYKLFTFSDNETSLKLSNYNMPYNLAMGFGFRYGFYFNNIILIEPAVEVGIEMSLAKGIIMEDGDHYFSEYSMVFPGLYFAFPISIEVPANSPVTFILGVSPTIRILQKIFTEDNVIWLSDYEFYDSKLSDFEQVFDPAYDGLAHIALDLFFYNMPIRIGLRIKI